MSGDGEAFHASGIELCALGIAVGLIGFIDLEMVAPAAEFHAIVAEGLGFLNDGVEREIGPLAGEKSDGSAHGGV